MIRLLLNADAPLEAEAVTRFGGRPLIPRGTDFHWPCCSSCDGPMQFLGQIAMEDGEATRLALVFMCQNEPGMCDDWDADSGGNRAIIVAADDGSRLADVPEDGYAVRDTIYGARVEAVDSPSYDEAREQWAQQNQCSPREVLGQVGGEPSWIQADETPTCDHCDNAMEFVAQLEAGPDYKTEMNFGGGGCAYVFRCSCTQPGAKFLWQCG
jgi:uncharacterized protein YwqG